jgi:hypothetical protein
MDYLGAGVTIFFFPTLLLFVHYGGVGVLCGDVAMRG